MKNENLERDYDKNPIIIKDYNYMFLVFFNLPIIPIVIYLYIYNSGDLDKTSLVTNVFIVMPALLVPYIYPLFKNRGKRKIIFTNDFITFYHENILLERIEIDKIDDIKRTFSDLYHKSQFPTTFGRIMSYIVFPIGILMNLFLFINKFYFHIYMGGLSSYHFFDAYIIFSEKKFINVLPTTRKEYLEIENYFKEKNGLDIKKSKKYYSLFGHLPEKINFEGENNYGK